jgi:cyclopropane-fatty-acyl-phospholipid synthase
MAQARCEGLDVTILLQDYRDLRDQFDRIVSVGMFEHVGPKNYHTYFDVVDRNLKPDGLFLLHTIGSKKTDHRARCGRQTLLPALPARRVPDRRENQ